MCRIWLRQVCVCEGAWGADGVCAIPHTLPAPTPTDPLFPYREVYFARVVPQYWMFKISRRALFFFSHLETYTGNVLGQLQNTHTHTHMETDIFPASSRDGRQGGRVRGGGGGRLHRKFATRVSSRHSWPTGALPVWNFSHLSTTSKPSTSNC